MKPKRDIIVALDVDSPAKAKALVRRLGRAVNFYKVAPSMQMKDPRFIPWLRRAGKKVFLDCKWYDIPSQVQRSVQAAGRAGVTACTIHTSAGRRVMQAALDARPRPLIWGVTVLTSLDRSDIREVGLDLEPPKQVLRLAKLAQETGLDGLVCSAQEVRLLRKSRVTIPLITPGIQWGGAGGKDQRRLATPQQAWKDGSNFLVIGRAILEAKDPARTAKDILEVIGG